MSWFANKTQEWNVEGEQNFGKNICPIFCKMAKTVAKRKKWQNDNIKAQFVSQTTFETLKYLQQTMFWNV